MPRQASVSSDAASGGGLALPSNISRVRLISRANLSSASSMRSPTYLVDAFDEPVFGSATPVFQIVLGGQRIRPFFEGSSSASHSLASRSNGGRDGEVRFECMGEGTPGPWLGIPRLTVSAKGLGPGKLRDSSTGKACWCNSWWTAGRPSSADFARIRSPGWEEADPLRSRSAAR